MQSYVFNLGTGAAAVRAFDVPADLFVYESGVPTPTTGDTRIKVKPNTGAEIVLRPGQRFRLAPGSNAAHWEVSPLDPAVTLTGYVIIGSGEFDDANTLNKVTLDATFANQVTVTNTPSVNIANTPAVTISGGELEVKNDIGNPLNVALTGVGQVQENLVAYTGCHSSSAVILAATPTMIVAPASNINGIIIHKIIAKNTAATPMSVIAKTSAPANVFDGDVLAYYDNQAPFAMTIDTQKIKIPAGKGLYMYSASDAAFTRSVVYTIL